MPVEIVQREKRRRAKQAESNAKKRAERTDKFCPKCQTTKPLDAFEKRKHRVGQPPKAYCIECDKAYNDARRKK